MLVVISLERRTHIFFQMRGAESLLVVHALLLSGSPCIQQQQMSSVHHPVDEVGPDALLVLLFMLVQRINSINSSELLKIALDEYLAG